MQKEFSNKVNNFITEGIRKLTEREFYDGDGCIINKGYLSMSFVICERHNRSEKGGKVAANAYVCMNRFCPSAFTLFCTACKVEHRDHSVKVLTLEDISFLTDRLMKTPFVEVGKYVGDAVDIMKKLKLIKQFRRKIELLEREIQKEALRLIEITQSLIHEYAACKASVNELEDTLVSLQQPASFQKLTIESRRLFSNLDYNTKKDKLEFGNANTREKEDRRRKNVEYTRHKIEEVKDYTMKIIEVILHNGDSSEGEEDIAFTKKHYELLKQEICNDRSELQLQSEISELKNSRSTANRSRLKKAFQNSESQTQDQLLSREEAEEEMESALNQMRSSHMRVENDLRLKISIIAKEKQNSNKEASKHRLKLEEKRKQIDLLEERFRKNLQLRRQKESERTEAFNRILELTQWKGLSLEDRYN